MLTVQIWQDIPSDAEHILIGSSPVWRAKVLSMPDTDGSRHILHIPGGLAYNQSKEELVERIADHLRPFGIHFQFSLKGDKVQSPEVPVEEPTDSAGLEKAYEVVASRFGILGTLNMDDNAEERAEVMAHLMNKDDGLRVYFQKARKDKNHVWISGHRLSEQEDEIAWAAWDRWQSFQEHPTELPITEKRHKEALQILSQIAPPSGGLPIHTDKIMMDPLLRKQLVAMAEFVWQKPNENELILDFEGIGKIQIKAAPLEIE